MESYLISDLYDLVTPDGKITSITKTSPTHATATVFIEHISPVFRGHFIEKQHTFFNIKSVLAQIGLDGIGKEYQMDPKKQVAEVKLDLIAHGTLAQSLLSHLSIGAYIGKLFAADPQRKVRNPDYLHRMFHRTDRWGRPLLFLGNPLQSDELLFEKVNGATIAFLTLLDGTLTYDSDMEGFIPTLEKALADPMYRMRSLLQLNQIWNQGTQKTPKGDDILLVKTQPLHIRTCFGRVVESLLPQGFSHTSASVLEPDTKASGDVYEFFGPTKSELKIVPLEFYTLEPHREHVFFEDRDQLQASLEDSKTLFKAFDTAPKPDHQKAAVFVVKGEQLLNLQSQDWITREAYKHDFPGLIFEPEKQAQMVQRYIEQQPAYPFLKAIQEGLITSQGVLFSRYFPSPLMKKMLLGDMVQKNLKGIYFRYPSLSYGEYFSHEDRSLLHDLAKFAIPVFWVDDRSGKILEYVPKPDKDAGMFSPLELVKDFTNAVSFGIYGSHREAGSFEEELTAMFEEIKKMRYMVNHPLFNAQRPIALITGGGPGVMEVGNKVARKLNLLSCANIVDFRSKDSAVISEQRQNPYVDIKMTYRLDRLVERQAEFNLDFPIILTGGIGTDFEFALEAVRRKIGSTPATPVLLMGTPEYWKDKVTPCFQRNLASKTIVGSEWISNCFYVVQSAKQALRVYEQYFNGKLAIGKNCPSNTDGFVVMK